MNFHSALGLARSVAMYYGIPGRTRRQRHFYAQFIRRGDLCFDIGAHVGNRIRIWLQLGARVVAVEPQPLMITWLKRLYGRNPRVILLESAVGRQRGLATLKISRTTPTVSSLSPAWIRTVQSDRSFADVVWDEDLEVPVVSLEDLSHEYGQPAFCKLDIEGFEIEALMGLDEAWPALSFEHIPAASMLTKACLDRLDHLGRYWCNYSAGESHRWHFSGWIPLNALRQSLEELPPGSGDIYAQRIA